jgi:hypothetical protein
VRILVTYLRKVALFLSGKTSKKIGRTIQSGTTTVFMKVKKLIYLIGLLLAVSLAGSASAQTDYNWSGAGDSTTWSQAANWVGGVVPPVLPSTRAIFLGTGYPTTSTLPITIGVSDVVQASDQLFGPEWGQTLNIFGTVNTGFGFAPVGAASQNTSVINMYGAASLTTGDSIFIGDMFWFAGGPNVAINLYDSAQMTTKYMAVGGHLNIYGGTVTVSTALLTGTPTAGVWGSALSTDATRLIDIAGGRLVVAGDITSQVTDLISRGVLRGSGIVGNVNIDTTSMPGWTVLTVPEPAGLTLFGLGGLALLLRRRLS